MTTEFPKDRDQFFFELLAMIKSQYWQSADMNLLKLPRKVWFFILPRRPWWRSDQDNCQVN